MDNGPDVSSLSAAALVARALAEEPGSDARWVFVVELHRRDDAPSLDLLTRLLGSAAASERELAADALGQFAVTSALPTSERPFATEIVGRLVAAGEVERDPAVMQAIAHALGHRGNDRAIPLLAAMHDHSDDTVREAVAFALGSFESDLATRTLLDLTADRASRVRDWATFGLGVLGDDDSEPIRQALLARLDDSDRQVRAEALAGLARRGDARCLPQLRVAIDHLDEYEDYGPLSEAAITMATRTQDPRLCAYVQRERDEWTALAGDEPLPDDLRAAATACGLDQPGRGADGMVA